MAATATRTRAAGKTATASKKSSSRGKDADLKLQLRYHRRMKLGRVHSLTAAVPGGKKRRKDEDDPERGMTVVLRPIIAGAIVTPAEQRLELTPGNQVTFHVAPQARGRLSHARMEVHAPGQPPEIIPLGMTVRSQKLALFFLLMAWLIPTMMIKWTYGSWKPDVDPVPSDYFTHWMKEDLPPIPIFNQKSKWFNDLIKQDTFVAADTLGKEFFNGWKKLRELIGEHQWLPNTVAAGFLFLALVAYMFNDPKKKRLVRTLDLDETEPAASDPVELGPM